MTLFALTPSVSWNQTTGISTSEKFEIAPFKLTVYIIEYSEMLLGDTKYVLTENNLDIINISNITYGGVESGDEKITLSMKLSPSRPLSILSKMNLDLFDTYYDDRDIMATSGQRIMIEFAAAGKTKEISFHCFYSKHLTVMTSLFNEIVPKDHKIDLCHRAF